MDPDPGRSCIRGGSFSVSTDDRRSHGFVRSGTCVVEEIEDVFVVELEKGCRDFELGYRDSGLASLILSAFDSFVKLLDSAGNDSDLKNNLKLIKIMFPETPPFYRALSFNLFLFTALFKSLKNMAALLLG